MISGRGGGSLGRERDIDQGRVDQVCWGKK